MQVQKGQQKQKGKNIDPQKKLNQIKLSILLTWVAFLYNGQHRCIMNYICFNWLMNRQITLKTLSDFKNSNNIAYQLAHGFLITLTQNKPQKTSIVKINQQFFYLIPKLIQAIKNKITPQLQKIKKYDPTIKKKICQVCQVQQTQCQLSFIGARCKCSTPKFIDVKLDLQKKARYQQLQKFISIMILKKQQFDQQDSIVAKKKKEINDLKQKKQSQYQKFIEKNIDQVYNQEKIQKNYKNIKLAQQLFSPYRQYHKINELVRIRQARQRRYGRQGRQKIQERESEMKEQQQQSNKIKRQNYY